MIPSQIKPEIKPEKPYDYVDFIPSYEDRVQRFILTISGGEFTQSNSYYTFSKFEPFMEEKGKYTPTQHQLKSVGFAMENLPSKDKESYYELIQRYVNPGKDPEPFDATIELVSGKGDVIQTWNYRECHLTDFDYFLQDNLLYFTMNGKKAISEIRDRSEFECIGFSVDFQKYDKNLLAIPDKVTKYEDRAVIFLFHASGGEFERTHSTGMISKFSSKNTLSDEIELVASSGAIRNSLTSDVTLSGKSENFGYPKFMGESLPNKFSKNAYSTIERYINPGKVPEPFDIRVDVVTGDGTILYSGDYDDCVGQNYSSYLNDNIAWIKFHPALKYEFRDRFEIECIGVDAIVTPQDEPNLRQFKQNVVKPIVQLGIGASPEEIVCKDNMSLMLRPPTNTAICVFEENVSKFEERGWIISEQQPKQISTKILPIIPTDDERAQKILVHLQSPDFSPKTIETFSKFSPIEKQNFPLLIPQHDFSKDSAFFYLESLPSKDKDWLYEILSWYINPGKKAEPMYLKIELFSGDDTLLQTGDYSDCERFSYEIYLDESVLVYKFHEKWQSEFKDRIVFSCGGLYFE